MNTTVTEGSVGVPEEQSTPELTGAQMLIDALRREHVEVIFGYPGGAVLGIYDALYGCGIPHILTRHEQGAIHAAEGYARVTGKVGVVIATSGPGATNLITGLADALLDSLPLVVFTGQVSTQVIGTDAFQEASIVGITMPVTKHNYQVRDPEELPRVIREAFHISGTGRKGPVLIDVPKDVSAALGQYTEVGELSLPGYQPTIVPNRAQIRKLEAAIRTASQPVILAGAGVLHARAEGLLKQFAEVFCIPVVNTLLGLGSFPPEHALYLGMAGMHGTYTANMALQETDLLISIGARFDDRVTGNIEKFAPRAKVAHIDIDPAEIGKNVYTHLPVVGDAYEALSLLLADFEEGSDSAPWLKHLHRLKTEYPFRYKPSDTELKPQKLVELIHELTHGRAVIASDVGQHQMWAAQFYPFHAPHAWVTSGGLGTMGFGLPAAIGAQIGRPSETVVAILGDAGFQMTLQELAVLREYRLPVKVVIVNNGALGMVRQWQEFFYDGHYSESLISNIPNIKKLSQAYGIQAFTVHDEAGFREAMTIALSTPEPMVIDCHVSTDENVYPMVPPGKGLHEMVGVEP